MNQAIRIGVAAGALACAVVAAQVARGGLSAHNEATAAEVKEAVPPGLLVRFAYSQPSAAGKVDRI